MTEDIQQRPPLPPFNYEDAVLKVRKAEDAWNKRNPEAIALAYSIDSRWRNRSQFIRGRSEIVRFLQKKWANELEYRLIKEIWAHSETRIAVRFAYEYHNSRGDWYRAYGNENWAFDENGLMCERHASINDVPIDKSDRLFLWSQDEAEGVRPEDHPGLSELCL